MILPTRNGGALLADCLGSILSQDDPDFEVVVSDNASDDRTPAILDALDDDRRLRVLRQPVPIGVTENWTAALGGAEGEYVLLLGDDDYLLPGAIARLRTLVEEYGRPDCLSFDAWGFAFPGSFGPGTPAHFSDPLFPHRADVPQRGEISPGLRREFVRDFFAFEFRLCPNLQTTLVARAALTGMRHGPFREPYPDFYALHALMLLVDRWVRIAEKLVVVGISTKSFGGTLRGGGSQAGRDYLGIDTRFERMLPGSDMLNGWHRTLDNLARDYAPELNDIAVSRSNYVYRQGYDWYLSYRMGWIDRSELWRRIRLLSPRDLAGFARELARRADLDMIKRHARVDDADAIASVWPNMRALPDVHSVTEFADRVAGARAT